MSTALFGAVMDRCPPVPAQPEVVPGLASCLDEGRLQAAGRAVPVSAFDLDAVAIVERALNRYGSVLICPSDPFVPLSALVAGAAHVSAMVRERLRSGRCTASPLRVAVVTGDLRLRGFYRSLGVAERRGVGGVPMKEIVPAATLAAGGGLSVIDRDDGRWSTVFVQSVAQAERLGRLDLLVVDLPIVDADRLPVSGVPTVVVAKDPLDPAVAGLARLMPAFGYDALLMARPDPAGDGVAQARLRNRRARRVRLVPVESSSVCSNAGLFWGDVGTLVRLGRRSPYVSALVREAFGLFYDLVGLAMPVDLFGELTARPLEARVDELARAARRVADAELRDEWLPMVEEELRGLLQALRRADRDGRHGDSKASVIRSVVAEALDDRRDVVVVARTAALACAYSVYLAASGLSATRVTSLGELAGTALADVAILPGMAPTWARWVYRSGVAPELIVLAYTAGSQSGSIPSIDTSGAEDDSSGAFDELALVSAAVGRQITASLRLSASPQRHRAWAALVDGAPVVSVFEGRREIGADEPSITVSVPRPPEVPPGLWDGAGWTAMVEPDSGAEPGRSIGLDEVSPGLQVTFADGSWAWLRRESPVWRWRIHSAEAKAVSAERLTVGDEVVFIDGDAHKTLLAKVLEVAEAIPELAVAAGWHSHWEAMLRRAYLRFGSYEALARQLGRFGHRLQGQTIRLWCIGDTIGPEDPEDVRRLGQVLADPVLTEHHGEVWRGMETLRRSHVRLGVRLAGLIRSLGPAAGTRRLPADEVIDPSSGLTAADLESAVVLLAVTRIEPVAEVPRVLAGKRRPAGESPELFTDSRQVREVRS